MAIDISSMDWKFHEYKVIKFDINVNGTITSLSDLQVDRILLEKGFDEDFLPIFLVQLHIPTELYYNICQNNKNTVFTIVMQSRVKKDDAIESTSEYLNDNFTPLAVDGTPFTDEKLYNTIRESSTSGEGSVRPDDMVNSHTFILSKTSTRNIINTICNEVLTNANMLDTISHLLTNAGASNVLMSTLDNQTVYNELVLLPVTLVNQLKYLDSFYGFYKEGSQIFLDFDTFYILRNCAKCTAYRKNEIKNVTFYIYDSSTGEKMYQGSNSDLLTSEGYIAVGSSEFSIKDMTDASGQYTGMNSIIINSDGSVSSVTNDTDTSTNIISTCTHNSFYSNEIKLRLSELKGIVTIYCSGIDLRLLTPNKKFKILSKSSKVSVAINADYRLVSVQTNFVKDGDHYRDISEIILKNTEG